VGRRVARHEEVTMASEPAANVPDRSGRAEHVALGRLLWVGPLAVVAAVAANLLFTAIATRLFNTAPEMLALTPGPIATFTAIGVLGAVVVFAIVARRSRRPFSLFRKIALWVLALSMIPDILLLFAPEPAGLTDVILLMITHVIAAAVVVWSLERFARA
jgi:hypothetical protein